MAINLIPETLLEDIFSQLRQDDLISIHHCCRRFYAIALPILYSTFDQHDGRDPKSFTCVRKFIAQPAIRPFVKHLRVSGWHERMDFSSLVPDLKAQVRECLDDEVYGKARCDEWCESLFAGETEGWDATFALLLAIFPNVRTLHVSHWEETNTHFVKSVCAQAGCLGMWEKIPLQRLREVSFEGGLLANCESFLVLPTVSTVAMRLIKTEELSCKGALCNITNLDLHSFRMEPDVMVDFLARFQVLRRFRYLGYFVEEYTGSVPLAIMQGLLNSKETLQEISVGSDNSYWYENELEEPGFSPSAFTRLRSLDIDIECLVGMPHDISLGYTDRAYTQDQIFRAMRSLPASLEHFVIRDWLVERVENICKLFNNREVPASPKKVAMRSRVWHEGDDDNRSMFRGDDSNQGYSGPWTGVMWKQIQTSGKMVLVKQEAPIR